MPDKKTPLVSDAGDLIDVPGAAEMLFVKRPTIRNWITRGKLKRYKVGGRTLLRRSELLALVREA
jgi:excisionase family DNA binding protein